MGGDEDGGGCVDAKQLIGMIKDRFQMTIDIEKLIKEIDTDGSGEIEFDEFQALLVSDAANNPFSYSGEQESSLKKVNS